MKTSASRLTILVAAALLLLSCGNDTTGQDTELASVLDSAADRAGVPPGTCRDECVAQALAVFDDCLIQSDDREMCFGRAIHSFFECASQCPPPTCEVRCEAHATQQFMSCVDETGEEDACAAEAREALQVCLDDECMDPEPPTCEDRCEAHAHEVYAECIGEDVDKSKCDKKDCDEKDCEKKARKALKRCVKEHCRDPKPPPCKDRCEALAEHVFEACTHRIDSEEICGVIARWFFEHCADHCEGPPEPPELTECRSDEDCSRGELCQIEVCVNTCVDDDPICVDTCLGVCVPHDRLCVCPAIFDPVCGEDGNVYPNACEAECAGVEVDDDGDDCDDEDDDEDDDDDVDDDCDDEDWRRKHEEYCD